MENMYLYNGSINPFWFYEQQEKKKSEKYKQKIYDKNAEKYNAAFDFLKQHSDKSDEEIAIAVINSFS